MEHRNKEISNLCLMELWQGVELRVQNVGVGVGGDVDVVGDVVVRDVVVGDIFLGVVVFNVEMVIKVLIKMIKVVSGGLVNFDRVANIDIKTIATKINTLAATVSITSVILVWILVGGGVIGDGDFIIVVVVFVEE